MSQSRSILMESERINPLVMAPSFPYFIFKKKNKRWPGQGHFSGT